MSTLRDYLELVRLPAVFTAMADVLMGAYVAAWTQNSFLGDLATPTYPWDMLPRPLAMLLLVAASSCLYLAGMALNDYFDRKQDALERPKRPIPSGRVSAQAAARLAIALMLIGLLLTVFVALVTGVSLLCVVVYVALALCVLLYDAVLKRTVFGGLAMGACRSLNVLLGMSLIPYPDVRWGTVHYLIAGGLGLFVAGITWVARTEAQRSHRGWLVLGLGAMVCGMAMIAWFPLVAGTQTLVSNRTDVWLVFWAVLAAQSGYRVVRAIVSPTAGRVQFAVRQSILSLVVIDAIITFAVIGLIPALTVLVLLIPTIALSSWFYVT